MSLPVETRWFLPRIEAVRGDQLLEIVRILDKQMNNTSVILLFEVGTKKLLFPGDAQLENWMYSLKEAKEASAVRKLLSKVDVYKVGPSRQPQRDAENAVEPLSEERTPTSTGRDGCRPSCRR